MSVSDTIRQFSRVLTQQQMQHNNTEFKRTVEKDYDGLNLTVKVTSKPYPGEQEDWDSSFEHFPSTSCLGERCICNRPATHKVAEETEQPRHPFTAYLCCECFDGLFGAVAKQWCDGTLAARAS